MKTKTILILLFLCFISLEIVADTHYVSPSGGNVSPFDTWEKAATNIQDGINVSTNGDVVLVTNGIYNLTEQISVTNNITVKSFNGADSTMVVGGFPEHTNRCFYLENDSIVDGFTISNGVVKGNDTSEVYGGGVYCYEGGTVKNCTITGNSALGSCCDGGGVYCDDGGLIQNCIIAKNYGYWGGGVNSDLGTVQNCIISENTAYMQGGGIFLMNEGVVQNCIIKNNFANWYGGGVWCNWGGVVQNCVIIKNTANNSGGGVGCWHGGTLINCTICKNEATETQIDSVFCIEKKPFFYNNIIYAHEDNNIWAASDIGNKAKILTTHTHIKNCCIGQPPEFIDLENNNFRLSYESPCVNRGSNKKYHKIGNSSETDLAGNLRVMNGKIDIGAYECNRDILAKYKIKWNKTGKNKIILKSKFKDYKNLGENLTVKIGDSFIISNFVPVKVKSKVAKYKRKTSPKIIVKLKVEADGILAKIKCLELDNLDNLLNITNETIKEAERNIDIEYYLGTNKFTNNIFTKYHSKKDKFCKGKRP